MTFILRLIIICAAICAVCSGAFAAIAVTTLPSEAVLTLDSGKLELIPVNDGAIEIRFSDGKTPVTSSLVLLNHLSPTKFDVRESADSVTVATAKMCAVVDRATGAISFRDQSGKTFLAETPGTRLLKLTKVQGESNFNVGQSFDSPADEHLFGLGQFQDGLWDWRGLPLELRQYNTQIAVPMLISSRGYGLLWDNASRTDFNPPGDEVPLLSASKSDAGDQGLTATEQLSAANSKSATVASERHGSFTTGQAGEYVFCTRDGDRRDDIAIVVDGVQIAGVKNMWTPRAVVGKISLPPHKRCDVVVRGGGKDVKLFARPLLGDMTTFRSDCGTAVDYTVFYGPKIDDVIAGYRAVTGQAPLWPKWAYGFWQCRERYSSQQQILDTVAEFRKREIPIDLIVQDWQYWGKHGWGSYEWDESQYPHPADMMNGLHNQNVKFMISVWCDPHGKTLDDLKANNAVVGDWIDVFGQKGRNIRWKYINQSFFSIGADAWWGDATEPGDPGTDLLGKKLSIGPGDQFTSAYPLFASQSLYEGQRATSPDKRVVILTRCAFPGQQRYAAAAWSGDVSGDWLTFKRQIPAGLNYCLTGLPYWTTDCGGFFRPKGQYASTDYNELLTRWFEWSTFCPILRIHGYQTETEMWKWLPATQANLLAYDRLRYRMLPYNYSVAWQVTSKASTIMRSLGMDFPDDANAWSISDQYMFGPAFLVAPVTEANATSRDVYLPGGTSWVNFWTGETTQGGKHITVPAPIEQLPLFQRAGSIVPLGPDEQYAMEKVADPIELRIYPGADGSFTLYEDEGDSYRYEHGTYATIPIAWNEQGKKLTLGERHGNFPGMLKQRTFRVVLVSPGEGVGIEPAKQAAEVQYDGRAVTVTLKNEARR